MPTQEKKNTFRKVLQTSQKYTGGKVLAMLVKLQGFTGATTGCVLAYYKTRNTGTRNTHGTTEQRQNNGTPPEQQNTPGTMETPQNRGALQ